MITPGTTGKQHHERSNHASTTRTCTTDNGHNRRSLTRRAVHENGSANRAAQPPNGVPFSCCKRAAQNSSKRHDLARTAVSWNGVFGGNGGFSVLPRWYLQSF